MLVCNCRGINEKQVNLAVKGARPLDKSIPAMGQNLLVENAAARSNKQLRRILLKTRGWPAPIFSAPALAKPAYSQDVFVFFSCPCSCLDYWEKRRQLPTEHGIKKSYVL